MLVMNLGFFLSCEDNEIEFNPHTPIFFRGGVVNFLQKKYFCKFASGGLDFRRRASD